jgi:hypothetical protein
MPKLGDEVTEGIRWCTLVNGKLEKHSPSKGAVVYACDFGGRRLTFGAMVHSGWRIISLGHIFTATGKFVLEGWDGPYTCDPMKGLPCRSYSYKKERTSGIATVHYSRKRNTSYVNITHAWDE